MDIFAVPHQSAGYSFLDGEVQTMRVKSPAILFSATLVQDFTFCDLPKQRKYLIACVPVTEAISCGTAKLKTPARSESSRLAPSSARGHQFAGAHPTHHKMSGSGILLDGVRTFNPNPPTSCGQLKTHIPRVQTLPDARFPTPGGA